MTTHKKIYNQRSKLVEADKGTEYQLERIIVKKEMNLLYKNELNQWKINKCQ
jgi:hypothetical protein